MNYQWDEEMMNYEEDFEAFRGRGFTEEGIQRLSQLRRDHVKLEKRRISEEHQRLAFARWLVATGRLSDQLA
jgi:hypothetical protein